MSRSRGGGEGGELVPEKIGKYLLGGGEGEKMESRYSLVSIWVKCFPASWRTFCLVIWISGFSIFSKREMDASVQSFNQSACIREEDSKSTAASLGTGIGGHSEYASIGKHIGSMIQRDEEFLKKLPPNRSTHRQLLWILLKLIGEQQRNQE